MRWTLADYLERHDLSAHQLAQHAGLSPNTIYPMAKGEAQRVDLRTLERVLLTLREMTGELVGVGDLLGLEGDQGAPWEALAGLLDHPAFDEHSTERLEEDLTGSLEQELTRR